MTKYVSDTANYSPNIEDKSKADEKIYFPSKKLHSPVLNKSTIESFVADWSVMNSN